jgi:hypothetical protein
MFMVGRIMVKTPWLSDRGQDDLMEETFSTLRGFLAGQEPGNKMYFAYSATLRIRGDGLSLDEITARLGLKPTTMHRKGDKRNSRHAGYKEDMWAYGPPVEKTRPLSEHIDALWRDVKDHKRYLLGLKKSSQIDVFLGYRCNCDNAGIVVPHESLEMFTELGVPLGISIIVT